VCVCVTCVLVAYRLNTGFDLSSHLRSRGIKIEHGVRSFIASLPERAWRRCPANAKMSRPPRWLAAPRAPPYGCAPAGCRRARLGASSRRGGPPADPPPTSAPRSRERVCRARRLTCGSTRAPERASLSAWHQLALRPRWPVPRRGYGFRARSSMPRFLGLLLTTPLAPRALRPAEMPEGIPRRWSPTRVALTCIGTPAEAATPEEGTPNVRVCSMRMRCSHPRSRLEPP